MNSVTKKNKLVSDYILDFLVSKGVKHVFILQGGAIAFLVDAFSRRKDIKYISVAHEQSAAMMADAYSRVGPNFGATMSTSGPGATNLITGICCSWFDSIPVLHITGQVNTYEQRNSYKTLKPVRQIGFQETEISKITESITKFSKKINNPNNIKYDLQKSYAISQEGRQGPVLIDIPMNFQTLKINSLKLKNQNSNKKIQNINKNYNAKIIKIINQFNSSLRPALIIGGGVRNSKSVKETNNLINLLKIPTVTTWTGLDCVDSKNKYLIGPIGVYGLRSANFTIQNADFIISIGARLDTRVTGGMPNTFAQKAYKVVVDIDEAELLKKRGLVINIPINSNAKNFTKKLLINKNKFITNNVNKKNWLEKCKKWKISYPIVSQEYYKLKKYVNPYVFFNELSKKLSKKDIIVSDTGAHLTWFMQTFQVKLGQRVLSAFGNSPMGYAFPASIGASLASKSKNIYSINGEGSFQINIQELQTLKYLNLPITVFVLNNKGYGIIKQFQTLYLNSRFEGTIKGYSSPNFEKITKAYGIKYFQIKNHDDIENKLDNVIKFNKPCLCEIMIKPDQKIIPKLAFGNSIDDLSPLLNREEHKLNMSN